MCKIIILAVAKTRRATARTRRRRRGKTPADRRAPPSSGSLPSVLPPAQKPENLPQNVGSFKQPLPEAAADGCAGFSPLPSPALMRGSCGAGGGKTNCFCRVCVAVGVWLLLIRF